MKKEKLNKQLKFISFFLQIREVFPKTAILSYRSKPWKTPVKRLFSSKNAGYGAIALFKPILFTLFLKDFPQSFSYLLDYLYRTIIGLFTFTYFYIGMLLENVIWNHVKQILQAAIWWDRKHIFGMMFI